VPIMGDAPQLAVQSWINKGSNPYPEWIQAHVAGKREANGSFLIHTVVGREKAQARVLVGMMAILRKGVVHARYPSEARALLAELDELEEPVPPHSRTKDPEAAVADRRDDTDDISARIAAQQRVAKPAPVAAAKPRPKAPERRQAYPAPLGAPPTIEWIGVDRLSIDDAYQRSTDNDASRRLIASIAAKFDWRLCAPLVVSRRPDGRMAVIDGQHRTLAAKRRADIPHLPCCVFSYDGPEEEARMFIAANRARKPMNRLDDFHAALAAADNEALEIQRLVTDAGLTIARNTSSAAWKPGEIAFTASIASTMRKHGAAVTSAALTNLAEAFPSQRVVHSGSIFLGLVKVLAHPPEGLDRDRLFRALLRYDAEEWGSFVQGLKGGDTRATAIREALMMAYDETPAEEPA
jgi:hypothetical protein